jgi:putative transposase
VDGKMVLNRYGKTIQFTWQDLPNHIAAIQLGQYVIMPNHFHGIITILDQTPDPANLGEGFMSGDHQGFLLKPIPTVNHQIALPKIVHNLKSKSTRRINLQRNMQGTPVWQRGYYEKIIRTESSYNNIVEYIQNNPRQWTMDKYYS